MELRDRGQAGEAHQGGRRLTRPGGTSTIDIFDGATTWRFDTVFLLSNWTCIFGRGCQGILAYPAAELGHGCCSLGAELDGEDEALVVGALAATLAPAIFQYHAAATAGGVFGDNSHSSTRVVDGACIFLNRPGFPGGAGCSLHLAALAQGESPVGLKPSVCWQLPIKVDWEPAADGGEIATVRGWARRDWGADGETMAWCCTESPEAYTGQSTVVDSMAEVLVEITGAKVYAELRRRLRLPDTVTPPDPSGPA